MKIILCSPYLDTPEFIKGGIQVWGKNILSYFKERTSNDLKIIPISFDRHTFLSNGDASTWKRISSGIKELSVAVYKAAQAINKEKPEIVHICTSASFGLIKDWILLHIAHKANAKVIIHLHFGRVPELFQKNNWEWKILSKIVKKVDMTIVMDQQTNKVFIANGFKKIEYIPNPISADILNDIKTKENKYNREGNRLLFVGQALRTKGIRELVSACVGIPNTYLRIVGKYEPDIKKELISIANERDNGKWITFVGVVGHNEVINEFLQATMFIFPSYTEGFPNVILEAMACGCPIASSNVGAIPEMLNIGQDDCGICFKPQDIPAIKKAIIQLLNNEHVRTLYAEKAKNRVNELYSLNQVGTMLTALYNKLLF